MFIERKWQRAASRHHRYYTFTLAIVHCCRLELTFPPCAAVHTACSRSRSKYPYEKIFQWRKIFLVEQYSSKNFSDNEYHLKISPLRNKINYGTLKSVQIMYIIMSVFISGVSLFQGYPYFRGVLISGVSLFQGCPYFRGVLISGVPVRRFHCIK